MNRQQLLDNVVSRIGNKGRSGRAYECNGKQGFTCMYVPSMSNIKGVSKDHPGCGIGCQPCFDDPNLKKVLHSYEGLRIHTIVEQDKTIAKALEVDTEDEVAFLLHMQTNLHDDENSWNEDGTLRQLAVNDFADVYGLIPPIVPSIG